MRRPLPTKRLQRRQNHRSPYLTSALSAILLDDAASAYPPLLESEVTGLPNVTSRKCFTQPKPTSARGRHIRTFAEAVYRYEVVLLSLNTLQP